MNVLHIYPINKKGQKPSSFRNSQIKSLEKLIDGNYLYPVLSRRNLYDLIKYGLNLRKEIKKKSIDVVHCHWGTSLALFGSLFSPVPFVTSFCGSDLLGSYTLDGRGTIKGNISKSLSVLASYVSTHNIVKSPGLLDVLPKSVEQKTTIVPNGVDSTFFYQRDKQESRKKLNLPLEGKIILFVDRPGAWVKNPEKARKIGGSLEKIGWGTYLEISNVSHKLMPLYFSAVDFLLITSFHEGSCNALKEALFCNLKVITSPTGDSNIRLKGIKECLISNSEEDIVKFVCDNADKEFFTPEETLKTIKLDSIAEVIYGIYKTVI